MTMKEYRKMSEDELKGREVISLREMSNGNVNIPAGAKMTIYGKLSGLKLKAPPCTYCGVSIFITRVEPSAVELLPEEHS